MRAAIKDLDRYIAGNRIGKRFLFAWAASETCPSDLTIVFAFDDDYAMGVLTSSTHMAWAMSEASTLRVDLRYTPTSCFETFPWPKPDQSTKRAIGDVAAQIIKRRQEICIEKEIGLTVLYNQIDDGAWHDVAALHRQLDAEICRAYGWPTRLADQPLELKTRLAALHAERLQAQHASTSQPEPSA